MDMDTIDSQKQANGAATPADHLEKIAATRSWISPTLERSAKIHRLGSPDAPRVPVFPPMKNPLLFVTLFTACLLLFPAVCLAQDSAPPANQAMAPAAGTNVKAEEYRAKAEAGDALAQAMLADALYYGIPSDAAF